MSEHESAVSNRQAVATLFGLAEEKAAAEATELPVHAHGMLIGQVDLEVSVLTDTGRWVRARISGLLDGVCPMRQCLSVSFRGSEKDPIWRLVCTRRATLGCCPDPMLPARIENGSRSGLSGETMRGLSAVNEEVYRGSLALACSAVADWDAAVEAVRDTPGAGGTE